MRMAPLPGKYVTIAQVDGSAGRWMQDYQSLTGPASRS